MFGQAAVLNVSSAKTVGNGEDVLLSVELTQEDQYIACYVMCDEIGTVVYPLSLQIFL